MAHLLKQILIEVEVSKLALVSTAEGSLASKRIGNPKLLPHDHSHGGLLGLLDQEGAVIEVEEVGVLVQ